MATQSYSFLYYLFFLEVSFFCSFSITPSIIQSKTLNQIFIKQTCSENNGSIQTLIDSKFSYKSGILLSSSFDLDSCNFKKENYNYLLKITKIEILNKGYQIHSSYLNLSDIIKSKEIILLNARIIDAYFGLIYVNYCKD